MTIQQAFELALQQHQAGRLAEAEAIYRQILVVEPRHADALHLLGVIAHQVSRSAVAVDLIRQAIAIAPENPAFHSNLAAALSELRRIDEAIAASRRAIQLKPDYPEAHTILANALTQQGQLGEAIDACNTAIQLKPDNPEAHNNLGNALAQQGGLDEAICAYSHAIRIRPVFAEAFCNLGNVLRGKGQMDEAIAACSQAIQLKPDCPVAYNNLGNAFKDAGRLNEAIECYRRAMVLMPDDSSMHSNLIYTLIFSPAHDAASICEESRCWDRRFAKPLRKFHRAHANDRIPKLRLRIGYISPDFCRHVVCHFLTPLLEAHDHAEFEIYCYASVMRPDKVTERLRKTADMWRDVLAMPDETLAERIREDRIDILVDLTQHTAANRLLVFARKPAPVQVAWLGYPGTCGLSAMDYRLTDACMEPEGSPWSDSVETPVRLPDSWFCFDPIDEYPEPGALPALRAGHVTFGSLNKFSKVNDAVLQLWATVLHAVEGSRLLLQCPPGATQARVREWFESQGIEAHRLELVSWMPTRADFLQLFDRIDLALEPFPHNGGTTTCEALWMGVPAPTFPGATAISRLGLSILSAIGLQELIAASQEDYVRLMVSLATDLPRLAALRATLRQRMKASAFMDAPRFARNVEHAYREMWRKWCGQQE